MQNGQNEKPDLPRTGFSRGMNTQLVWACAIIGLIAALVVFWMFGVNLWTAIVFALLIGCPVIIGWLLLIDRQSTMRKKP